MNGVMNNDGGARRTPIYFDGNNVPALKRIPELMTQYKEAPKRNNLGKISKDLLFKYEVFGILLTKEIL